MEVAMKDYDEIMLKKGLPSVGQEVRSKKYGSTWRVMEKREVWENIDPDPKSGELRMVPAIYLSFWKVSSGNMPGVGKLMGFKYTLYDNTFEANWQVVK
jgi:hypothetical protein